MKENSEEGEPFVPFVPWTHWASTWQQRQGAQEALESPAVFSPKPRIFGRGTSELEKEGKHSAVHRPMGFALFPLKRFKESNTLSTDSQDSQVNACARDMNDDQSGWNDGNTLFKHQSLISRAPWDQKFLSPLVSRRREVAVAYAWGF